MNRIQRQTRVKPIQKICKIIIIYRKYNGWNDREINAKDDDEFFKESDDDDDNDEENSTKKHSTNNKKHENIYNPIEKLDYSIPVTSVDINDSNIILRTNSKDKVDERLLNKKHELDKIVLYDDNNSNLYDLISIETSILHLTLEKKKKLEDY